VQHWHTPAWKQPSESQSSESLGHGTELYFLTVIQLAEILLFVRENLVNQLME